MQALYKWHMTAHDAAQIEAEFLTEYDMARVDTEYFHTLVHGAISKSDQLTPLFVEHLDRELKDLDPVELALLLLGVFELLESIDVPFKVVINENVNLAKKFGATDSHKYINGVLDKVAQTLRKVEVSAGSGINGAV